MSTTLLDQTRKLLSESSQTQKQIAEGAEVNYWWFIKFAQGAIPDPGVTAVQKVHDYLMRQKQAAA